MSRFDRSLLSRALAAVQAHIEPPAPHPVDSDLPLRVAAALCRRFEGYFPQAYLCPAGYPTIGYGSRWYEDGRAVTLKDQAITREQAEALLLHHLRREYLPAVMRLCPGIDSPYRLAALVDWTYNLGSKNLEASTLRKRVRAGQWDAVPAEIRRWNRAGGRVLRGLTVRREAEAQLVIEDRASI